MTTLIPFHWRPAGALHIGTHSTDPAGAAEYIPSDTLFAALTAAHRVGGGDVRAWSDAFGSDPPLLLTSAFPRAGEVRFLPLPAYGAGLFDNDTRRQRGKNMKSIAYFSEALWQRWMGGQSLSGMLFPDDEYREPQKGEGAALQGGALWLTFDEIERLPEGFKPVGKARRYALRRRDAWKMESIPHVRVGRVNSAPTLFHSGRITFAPDCGLWFGVQWRDPERPIGPLTARTAFERALTILQDHGLGGERSVGYGGFEAQAGAPLDLPTPRPGAPAYLLSRYHPTAAEIKADMLAGPDAAYQTVRVGGFLHSPDGPAQLRRSLRLVEAGSLIRWPIGPDKPPGELVDVRPRYDQVTFPHPVWRYGYAAAAATPPISEVAHG